MPQGPERVDRSIGVVNGEIEADRATAIAIFRTQAEFEDRPRSTERTSAKVRALLLLFRAELVQSRRSRKRRERYTMTDHRGAVLV